MNNKENTLPPVCYGKILYATDLSESGRLAFPHAVNIARCNNSQLTVFHTVKVGDLESLLGYASDELWNELTSRNLEDAKEVLRTRKRDGTQIKEEIRQQCEDALSSSSGDSVFNYDIKVKMGEPLEKILEEANQGDYNLVVVSKHGNRKSVKDAVLGDVTRRIVRRCKIPVLVIPVP